MIRSPAIPYKLSARPFNMLRSPAVQQTAFLAPAPLSVPAGRHCAACISQRPQLSHVLRTSSFRRHILLRPNASKRLQGNCSHLACSTAVNVAGLFTDDTAYSESLFAKCVFELPTGTTELAMAKGVDIALVSAAYGRVIARKIREDIPVSLDPAILATACKRAGRGEDIVPSNSMAFERWLATVRAAAADNNDLPPLTGPLLEEVSFTYGAVMGKTARLTALELDFDALATSLEDGLKDPSLPFPMDDAQFQHMFATLEDCAADVLGTSNMDNADSFFKQLRAETGVSDLQGDGYILSVNGNFRNSDDVADVSDDSTVHIALQVRLLDGRAVFVPTFSDGDGSEADYIESPVASFPPALNCAIQGMRPSESRTVFYHPYAAHEVLSMFMPTTQLPPQAGAVVNLFLRRIM